jgi:hypothetical protein
VRKLVPFVACGDLSGWDKESLADEQAFATGDPPHAHMEPQSLAASSYAGSVQSGVAVPWPK